jgi:hypothetical protein
MTVKAPRGLTHSKHLYSPEKWLERMSERLQCFGDRLGTLLVQLSPQFGCDSTRLAYFLEQMPFSIKVPVEFQHPNWHTEEVFSLLERERVAYCAPLRGAPSVYPACNELPESMCASTVPTPTTSTAAATRMMICSDGPIASTSRKVRGDLCWSTSTTREREMQFGTLQS